MNATTFENAPTETVSLPAGPIEYHEIGPESGRPVVFVHGLLVNGGIWNRVTERLVERTDWRLIVPTLPLGGHTRALHAGADRSLAGLARLLGDFLDAIGLDRVALVGSDLGTAICQVFLGAAPERVESLVLTNGDAFEHTPPLSLVPLAYAGRVPAAVEYLSRALRVGSIRRAVFAAMVRQSVPDETLAGYTAGLDDPAVRRDLGGVLGGLDSRPVLEAGLAFREFPRPVLIAWGLDDLIFPESNATRLETAFPESTLRFVAGSRTLVPIDRPTRLATLIETHLDGTLRSDQGATVAD